MYLVVYGLRNAGLTEYLSAVLNILTDKGLWAATLGIGFLTVFLSSVMNNMPTVLIGVLSIDGSAAAGVVRETMIYANVIGCYLGPKIPLIVSLGNTAVASCAGVEKRDHHLGKLLLDRHHHDLACAFHHSARAGMVALGHFVMRY